MRTREVSGLLLREAIYPAGTKVLNHAHTLANLCIVLKGACTETYQNKVREYKTLSLDFLPADEVHSLEFPRSELHCFSIDIAPRWLERMREISLFHDRSVHYQGGFLADLFMKLYREFHMMDAESSLAIEGLAFEMLAEVSRRRAREHESNPRWLERARELLHAHYSESLRLVAIAGQVGVHPLHLAREFRKHYGYTFGDYIRKLRIDYACDELSRSDMPLVDIAVSAGFADHSHFSRMFKRATGMTPAQYRAAFRAR